MKRSRILDYILLTAALPIIVWLELNEASQDISLALTGGKYSGWGRLNRKRYRDDDDEPAAEDFVELFYARLRVNVRRSWNQGKLGLFNHALCRN